MDCVVCFPWNGWFSGCVLLPPTQDPFIRLCFYSDGRETRVEWPYLTLMSRRHSAVDFLNVIRAELDEHGVIEPPYVSEHDGVI